MLSISPFSVYTLPMGMLPLLLALLSRNKTAASCTVVLGDVLVGFFVGRNFQMLLFFAFGGLVALLTSSRMRRRSHVLLPSLLVGIVNAVVVVMFSLNWEAVALWLGEMEKAGGLAPEKIFNAALAGRMAWGLIGGLVAGPAALALVPPLELAFHTASAFELNKYTDLQHPLMTELLTKAPGTYQHSMSVAHLAHVAASAVGLNALLIRAGADYHDIGKTCDPRLFVENQYRGDNPHDEMDPAHSAGIIMEHVIQGIKIATKAGLPRQIVDFIPQHHGTQLIEYFYNKAKEAHPETMMPDGAFRYPGPKPQAPEAGILMIVDAVEAASRTIQDPTPEKIDSLICGIIEKRLSDGQFDECNLSTCHLATIRKTLTESLMAAFHNRVEYPWQKQDNDGIKPLA